MRPEIEHSPKGTGELFLETVLGVWLAYVDHRDSLPPGSENCVPPELSMLGVTMHNIEDYRQLVETYIDSGAPGVSKFDIEYLHTIDCRLLRAAIPIFADTERILAQGHGEYVVVAARDAIELHWGHGNSAELARADLRVDLSDVCMFDTENYIFLAPDGMPLEGHPIQHEFPRISIIAV
jgi:hypothetical protein